MTSSVLDRQRQLIRAMSPEAKIHAAESLRAIVWDLKAGWIRSQHPTLSESEVQDAVRHWFRSVGA
jgi:hypothetical protein